MPKSGLAFVSIAAVLGAPISAVEARSVAPITIGVPPRALTDPRSLLSVVNPAAGPVTIADLYFLRSSWSATWTPDGQNIVMSCDLSGRQNLWKVPAGGGFPMQLQQSEEKSFYSTVSPDGRWAIFASDKGGREIYDLYATPITGGATVKLTSSDGASNTQPLVSPDNKTIAFIRRGKNDTSSNIALLTLNTREVKALTHETSPAIDWFPVAFTGDAKRLIVNRANSNLGTSTIWSIDPGTGAASQLEVSKMGRYGAASSISHDGKFLALTVEVSDGRRQAAILDLVSRRLRLLKPDGWIQTAGQFSPDGRTLLAASNIDGRDEVFSYDVASGATETLALPEGVNALPFFSKLPAFSPDGKRILFAHSSGSTPFDYWIYDRAGHVALPITRFGIASVDPRALPKTQVVHYRSFDGTVISAIMWMPFNLDRDGSAPGIVIAHGGYGGQTSDWFDPTAVALASRGYVVIAPNVRGSGGYGRAFEQASWHDLGGGDLQDEAAGAQFLVASGYVDRRKIGITGGSFGGFMTLIALSKMPDLWAAGVEEYGIVDWKTMYEKGSAATREDLRVRLGDPVMDKAAYAAASPLTYLRNARAPLLVLHGENDVHVPPSQAAQIADVLKSEGRTVEVHYYAEEGHGFLRRENQIDALERLVAWFDRYLGGKGGGKPI